ncbi:hypothetical protein PPL_02818 [Heterostelium album PN500]|uniref:UBA domain-containing protein n=1 Tax=Heterostelium pallidum (strain ATCC 26659 / Pp 5 / PN500) TaxID=670386 RepID=D3B353_HETP5|nr:hypothetical protein PPL_02818 [Heterostelium album PN500]EFA83751.1 hypothetical protein PPL_02818 [Heterostelium album PN500]|eukprot:XP_020435868.1 hypothetical protein PPL_02818 [Heterostelium album PN500]
MYSAGPSGLQNAPVTKIILITVIGSTLLINYINAKHRGRTADTASAIGNISLSPFALTANQFYFRSLGELLTGSILIYSYRIFERLMGSSKYTWIAPLVNAPPAPTSLRPLIEQQQQLQNLRRHQQQQQQFQTPFLQAVLPSEENIAMLVSMGFPRNLAVEALQRTNNNLNDATNFLLGAL